LSSVDWLEVRLAGPLESSPRVEAQLAWLSFPGWVDESGPEGFDFLLYLAQEPGWQERLQPNRQSLSSDVLLTTHGQVRDEDWSENWKKFYHPLEVGQNLVICPSWEAFQPTAEQKVVILDPGSAFGTGITGALVCASSS